MVFSDDFRRLCGTLIHIIRKDEIVKSEVIDRICSTLRKIYDTDNFNSLAPDPLQTFFVSAVVDIIENTPGPFGEDIGVAISLVRLFLKNIANSAGESLRFQTKSFRQLLSIRSTSGRYAKRLFELYGLEKELSDLSQEVQSESEKPQKSSKMSHQRGSPLALDLWAEIELHSDITRSISDKNDKQDSYSVHSGSARLKLSVICLRQFWINEGSEIILRKISELSSISSSSPVEEVIGNVETAEELFQLILVTALHPSAKHLQEALRVPFPINVPKHVTDKVCEKGLVLVCEILQNAMLWAIQQLLVDRQLTKDETDKVSLLVSSLTQLHTLIQRVKNCPVSLPLNDNASTIQFAVALLILQDIDQLLNLRLPPSVVSEWNFPIMPLYTTGCDQSLADPYPTARSESLSDLLMLVLALLPDLNSPCPIAVPSVSHGSYNSSCLDHPVIVKDLKDFASLSLDQEKPHPLFCGRPLQLVLFRLAASVASQIMEQVDKVYRASETETGQDVSRHSKNVNTPLFHLLDAILKTLHHSLLVRASFLRHFGAVNTDLNAESSLSNTDERIGCYFAQFVQLLDSIESRAESCPTLDLVYRLNASLSKVIYLLASEPNYSGSSETGLIADCAMRYLGYDLTNPESYSSLPERWILCPGPRIFCLLGNRVISRIHAAQTTDTTERFIKSIWLWFLHGFQFKMCGSSDNPRALMDVNPNLMQLVCLLAGQIPGLTAKKSLLCQLMSCFNRFASLPLHSDTGISTGCYYHLCTRLVVLLRYLLHHFYVPPAHLADQLKSSLTLNQPSGQPANRTVSIWTYDVIQSELVKISHLLRPCLAGGSSAPLFYDLLTPASFSRKDSTENTTRASWNLPSPDGLAILSLIYQENYDALFAAPLKMLDAVLLMRPWELSTSVICDSTATSQFNPHFVQSGQLPTTWYQLILVWRLFEILPPSPKVGLELHSLLGKLTRSQRVVPFNVPKIAHSPAHLIYLAVFLDRIQGRPSSVEPQLLSELAAASVGSVGSKNQRHPLVWTSSQDQAASRKAAQTVHQLSIEIYRAVCAKYGVSEKSAEKLENVDLPSEMLSSPFAHVKEIRNFLLALRHPTVSLAMFYTLAVGHIHGIRDELTLDQMSQGQLVYLSGLVHLVSELLPFLLSSEKSALKPTLSTMSSDSSSKRKSKQRLRLLITKTSAVVDPTDGSGGAPAEATDLGGSVSTTTSANVETVIDPTQLQHQPSEGTSNTGQEDLSLDSGNKEETQKSGELSEEQLSFVRENSIRSSTHLLLECVNLLAALMRSLRCELGLPCYSPMEQNDSLLTPGNLAQLTLLSPERLVGAVEMAGFPSKWISTMPARRRLANSLRLAMTPFQEAFTLLSSFVTNRIMSMCDEQQHASQHFLLARSLFFRLSVQFRVALDHLGTGSQSCDTPVAQTEPSQDDATRLSSSLRIRQLCFLGKRLDTLANQIARHLFGCIFSNRSTFVECESAVRTALQLVSWLALDPVSSAIGLNPVSSTAADPSVANCLASMLIIMKKEGTSTDAPMNRSELYDRSVEVVQRHLEDHMLASVFLLAKGSVYCGPTDTNYSRILSLVCQEAFGYLEVATGHTHVVERCLSVNPDSDTYPLLDLFLCTRTPSSSTVDTTPTESVPSFAHQSSVLRLLCVMLLRAVNASDRRSSIFGDFCKRALERCMSGGSRSLISYWLSSTSGFNVPSNLFGCSDRPWLVEFIGALPTEHLNERDLMESEEWSVSEALNTSLRYSSASSGTFTPQALAQWNASRRHFRLALYFERFTRLLASPWFEDSAVVHQFCADILTEAIANWRDPVLKSIQSATAPSEDGRSIASSTTRPCLTLPLMVSALRCLSIGCSSGMAHVKLIGIFSTWSDAMAPLAHQLSLSETKPDADLSSGEEDRGDLVASLCTSLRGIYEYVTLVIYALNPAFQPNDDASLATSGRAPDFCRPRLGCGQSILRDRSNTAWFWTTDPSVLNAIRNYSRFCSALLIGRPTDRVRGLRKTSSETRGRSASHIHGAPNPVMSSTENVMDPEEEFSGPELISDHGDEDRFAEDLFMTLPGPLINQEVCSYTATQQAFVDQHWYHCHSCRLEYSEGVCSVCARVCHSGHDLSYAKHSTFFCDCGASKDLTRRCRALSCRLQSQSIHSWRPFSRQDRITRFVDDGMLAFYAPWLADGFLDSSRSPLVLSAIQSVYGDSEDNRMSDFSDGEMSATDRRTQSKSKLSKTKGKDTHISSLPPTGQKTESAPSKANASATVAVSSSSHPCSSSATSGPESLRRLLSNVRRSSGALLAPDSSVTGTGGSVLRRAGAVRYKLVPSDANTGKLRSKSNSGSQSSAAADDVPQAELKSPGRISRAVGQSRHSSYSLSEPTVFEIPGYSRQSRLRCARIAQFWRLVDCGDNLPPPVKTGPIDDDRTSHLSSIASRLSLHLIPDEHVLIRKIREQLSAPDAEKCRSNLVMLLTTSNVINQATAFLLESDGICLISQLLDTSTSTDQVVDAVHEHRLTAVKRLLSDKREACPVVRVCDNISLPVPSISNAHKDLWRRVLQMGRVLLTQPIGSLTHKDSVFLGLLPSGRSSLSEIPNLSPLFNRVSVSSITGSSVPVPEPNAAEPTNGRSELDLADQAAVQLEQPDQNHVDALSSLSSLTPDSVWASNSGLLLQTLASLVQQSESNVEGEFTSGSSLLQQIGEVTGGPNNAGSDPDRPRPQFSSDALLAALDLLCYRNASPTVPTIHPSASSNSIKQSQVQQHCVMCPLRVYQSKKRKWCNFLVVSGFASPPTNLSRQASNTPETGTPTDPAHSNSRVLLIYQMDKFCRRVARCQDNGMLELAKLQAITALLQSRGDQGTHCATTLKTVQNQAQLLDALIPRPNKSSNQTAVDFLSTLGSGTGDLVSGFRPMCIKLDELPRVCIASVGFEIVSLSVNPVSPSVFAACGAWDCVVLGVLSSGQVCGRINIVAGRRDRTEQLLKAIWLPDSINLLALLTTRSVQIFDIFEDPNKPKYHFKPVEGSFCDATFIRPPNASSDSNGSTSSEKLEPRPPEWGVYLLVMAKMGSILYQELGPECQGSTYPFFLAEWLEWSPEAVTLDSENSTDDDSRIPPLQRNATTGVLSGGGVSVQYISSLGLLLHAYQSGHSVASAIGITGLTAPSEPHLRITHSFLLATGRKRPKNGTNLQKQQSQQQQLCTFGSASPVKLVTSLLFAARSACNPSSSPKTPNPEISQTPKAHRHPRKQHVLPVGPIVQWSEVLGGHPGLVSAMSIATGQASSEKNTATDGTLSPNITLLLAFEPDQVWIQPIQPKLMPVATMDQKISKLSSEIDGTSEPKTPTNQLSRQADTITPNSVQPTVVASASVHWDGYMTMSARTLTYLLTSDGQLLVLSTCPKSVSQLVSSHNDLSQPTPGQFWLQPRLAINACGQLDSVSTIVDSGFPSFRSAPNSVTWSFCLPQGSLWDLVNSSCVERPKPTICRTTDSGNPLIRTKSLHNHLVDSPHVGPPPLDLFEYVSPTAEVEFGGGDLLQLYNRDQLRRRLLTLGSPVTGAGSSLTARMNREGTLLTAPGSSSSPWEPTLTASTTTSTSIATSVPGTTTSDIAFVIEVYNRKPGESVIAGVRVGLPAATGEYTTRWPKFFKVFNRMIPVTPPAAGAQYRFVDIPLYRSEMLLSSHLLHVFVGHSSDPEGLTSVDLVTVFTAPKSDVNWRHGRRARFSGRSSPMTVSWSRSRAITSFEWIPQTISPAEYALACRLDRLFVTGFVTTRDPRSTGTTPAICLTSPPLPPCPAVPHSLIVPTRRMQYPALIGQRSQFIPTLQALIASVCEMITSALLLSIGIPTAEKVLQQNTESPQCSAKMLDKLNFGILQSQAARVLNYLFLTVSRADKSLQSFISPQEIALQQHALDLLLVTTRIGCEAQHFSAERLKGVLDHTLSEAVSLAVVPVKSSITNQEMKCSTQLLIRTQRLTRLIFSFAICDPLRFSLLVNEFRLLDLFESVLAEYDRRFPPTSCAQGIFSPVWTKGLAVTCPSENQTASDRYVRDMRSFIVAVIRGLFAISMSTFHSSDACCSEKSRTEQHKEKEFIYKLITHNNLSISCAARDALSWLILRARPSQPIAWSTVDPTNTTGKSPSTTMNKADEISTGVTKTSDACALKDRADDAETRDTTVADSHVGQTGVAQFGGRQRPNRHVVISGNRLRSSWLSWGGQLTLEQALARIIPEYTDQPVAGQSGGGLNPRGMLCDFMDLEQGETTGLNRDRQAELVIEALRRRHPTLLVSSRRLIHDEDGVCGVPGEDDGNLHEANSMQNQLFNMDTNAFDADHAADHEDHIEEDDDVDDHYENVEDECGGAFDDDEDDGDDDEDEDEDPDEDNGDSEDNAVLGDSTSFSNEVTALLAQLIADTEQHPNSDGSVFFSDLSWPVVCPSDSGPCSGEHQGGSQSGRTLDAIVTSNEPVAESNSHRDPDSHVGPGTSATEEPLAQNDVDAERREDEPIAAIWDSDEDAIDPEVFETVLHMMNSAESNARVMYQDILERVDADDWENYNLQLCLRELDHQQASENVQVNVEPDVMIQDPEADTNPDVLSNTAAFDQPQNQPVEPTNVAADGALVLPELSDSVPGAPNESTENPQMDDARQDMPAASVDVTTQVIGRQTGRLYSSPTLAARSSDSERESDFVSHILSPFGSLQSLDRRGSVRSFSVTQAISSSSSTTDSDSSVPSEATSLLSRARRSRSRARNYLFLRFALEFAQLFTRHWPETVQKAVQLTPTTDVQSLAPALQLAVTLVRTLHANAAYLHYLLSVRITSTEPVAVVRTERLNKWAQQLQTVRTTLRGLITCLLTTLLTISVLPENPADSENSLDESLRHGLRTQLMKSDTPPVLQLAVLHLSALCEMFARVPYVTRHSKDSTSLSLAAFLWKPYDTSPTSDEPASQEKVVSGTTNIMKHNVTPTKLMNYCLTLLEVIYCDIERQGEFADRPENHWSTETEILPNTSTNSAALGLLQSALFSNSCSSGLLNGSGATLLASWSPLLDASMVLNYIGNPWYDLGTLVLQACLRLPRILLLLLDSNAAGRPASRISLRKTTSLPSETESRWCSVLYNYMELITNPEFANATREDAPAQTNRAIRLAFLDHSHPHSKEVLENFENQIRSLHKISSCLSVAHNRPHCWQRFCLKCPVLSNATVARTPQETRPESTSHTAEMRLALSMARHLIPASSTRVSTSSSDAVLCEPMGSAPSSLQAFMVSPLLFQFVRVFLCHCPDSTIRTSAMHIVRAIYKSTSSHTQRRLLQLVPLIWPELSTFAPYATQFVNLTTEMLVDHPAWSGRPVFLQRVIQLMLRRLQAVRRHPRRTLYTSIMHLIHPQQECSEQLTTDVATLRRIIPDLLSQRSALVSNDAALSRSWSSVAGSKPPTPAPLSQITASITPTATQIVNVSIPVSRRTEDADEVGHGDLGLGCALELEPCLMCHSKAVEEPSYVMLRWDSEPGSSRLPVRVVHWVMPTHYGRFVAHLEQAISQQQQLLTKQNSSSTEVTTPTRKLNITDFFNVLYKRPRYVRTLNIYTSDLTERSTSRLVHEPSLWQKVATVHLAPNQTAVCLCFAHPAPVPSWLGSKDYATDVRFSPERLQFGAPVQRFNVGHGLPIRASRLIFEYADFHSTGAETKRVCPRCHASNLLSTTCLTCHTNINECFRCRSIDLSAGDVYLCASCGSSRYGKIEFTIVARPCYAAVEPLHDREDRDSACRQIVVLSRFLVHNALNLAQPIQMDIAQCLNDITLAPLGTNSATVPSGVSSDGSAVPKMSATTNDKALLASLTTTNSPLGAVHASLTRLASCVAEASAISLDTAAITRRLWATRQSVMEFDLAQHKAGPTVTSEKSSTDPSGSGGWPDYEALDDLFDPPVGGCYSCLLNVIHHCGRLLLGVAEHSTTEEKMNNSTIPAPDHWLFECASGDSSQMVSGTTDANPQGGLTLLQHLITVLVDFGLGVYPRPIQSELQSLIIQLTRDSPALISHLGQQLTTRLIQAASCHGNQSHLVSSLVHSDVSLLQASVETILPRHSTTEIPGHMRPMDRRASSWEMRLRPLFRVILGLTKSKSLNHPDLGASPNAASLHPPVVQAILLPLLETLEELAAHGPSTRSLGICPHAPRDTPSTGDRHGTADQSKPNQLGAKGETRPPRRSATSDPSALLASHAIPPINFSAWLNEFPHASYSAWNDRLKNRQHSNVGTKTVVGSANQNNKESNLHIGFSNSRQKALVTRFASRWRAVVSELRWARRWNPPASVQRLSPNDPIPSDTWLTTVLFDPPDSTARAVNVCMDLLKSLSTYPSRTRKHTKSSSSALTTISSHRIRNSSLFNLCQKRRRLILCYLTQICLPRLDELAPARGSAFWADPYGSYLPLSSNAHLLNAGNAFVYNFRHLVGTPDSSSAGRLSSAETTESGHAPLVPYLLIKANFLSHIAHVVERLLSQMQRLESTTLLHWNELIASTMGSVSGTGALNGSTPSHTIAYVAELLRILEPLKNLGRKHQYSLLHILLHACVRLRQLVLQRSACTAQAEEVFSSMLDQLTGVSGSQIRDFIVTTLNVLAQYPLNDHQAALYLWKRMCVPVCPFDTDQAVFNISLEVWRGHEDYLLTRSRTELVSSETRGFGPTIHDVIDYICTGNNLTTDMRLEIVCENQILMPELRLQDVYTQVWCANRNNVNKPMRLLYRIPGLEADNLPYVEQLDTAKIPPEQYSHLSVLATHPHGLNGLLKRLSTIEDPVQTRDLLDVIFHILGFCLKIDECRIKLIDPELKSIPILLHAFILYLQADQSRPSQSGGDGRGDAINRLIEVLEPILQSADATLGENPNASLETVSFSFAHILFPNSIPVSHTTGDLNSIHQLLSCVSENPELPVISSGVARLLGLLAFGDEEKMDAIVQFLKVHLVRLKPSEILSDKKESTLLDCCCALMISIRRDTPNGSALRNMIVRETSALEICLRFL
ncbi:E3 ubiquitin-protein ligase UBR4 [Fasciola gigantica]|uniref:E3 ubiquitin-protein ligase UBR4 n=1 Tax=Fasciola gigantica TaxID=46835 RepID=A0A504YEV0_FASGI|nr:E3 ubiquitin-protein ligase UBR4 [Fasciola gigantica]